MEHINALIDLFNFDWLLNPLVVSILFGLSSIGKFRQKQYEHAFSRLGACLWYFYLWYHPEIPIEIQRKVGRWAITQIAFIEVLSFVLRGWFAREYKNALKVKPDVK